MRIFDTKVQHLKYKVLREVAKAYWEGDLDEKIREIPRTIVPGPKPSMRCCIYKERAIVEVRIKLAMGGDQENPNVIETIKIACDECPMGGYQVSDDCRGCLAHRCEDVCPRGAIVISDAAGEYHAHIDKSKCINCGKCAQACPYGAILDHKRPCQKACHAGAISYDENQAAVVDNSKCVSCGACVYMCPWGAIVDKSFMLDCIDLIKGSDGGKKYPVYAVAAPSIASQFQYAKLGQVLAGMKKLGFTRIYEAALGADMVAKSEAKELSEKGRLTSSCCPAFVMLVEKHYPGMAGYVSHTLSPAAMIARAVKEREPGAKIVFVGPCTAKKMEFRRSEVRPYIDCVITFEELQAMLDSRDIEVAELEEDALNEASYFGRSFARSGGVSEAIQESLKEQGLTDFALKSVACSGIEECKVALLKAQHDVLHANFIEGMGCAGGCINGAAGLTHEPKNKSHIDDYAKEASHPTILDAVEGFGR